MNGDELLILGAQEVRDLLDGRDEAVMQAVESAYLAHRRNRTNLPHSTFLRFPGDDTNRIIALPAYLGDGFGVAGVKWIASFPGNVARGMDRASAVVVLNSCETGRPEAILEGSLVSARRTAASAALAARALVAGPPPGEVGLVGTGVVNLEVARFVRQVFPGVRRFLLFDLDAERAARMGARLGEELDGAATAVAPGLEELLERCRLISFATTAVEPHLDDLSPMASGSTILHVSLRDLTTRAILDRRTDNVVDDPDHVCRAQTSIHLAEQATGSRSFIRCTLAEILEGTAPARRDPEAISVFSPFGLGILDLAVAKLVVSRAGELGGGIRIEGFLPVDETRGRP